jgi:Type IV secretion system pilin
VIKKLKLFLTTLSVVSFTAVPIALPTIANASATSPSTGGLCGGANLSFSNGTCQNTTKNLDGIIKFVLNLFSILVGITAVIMIVIGGFKYITSGGEPQKASGAKDTILFAIVGLVVVSLAQIIVHFVLNNVNQHGGSGG